MGVSVIVAPHSVLPPPQNSIFLAGGITDCPDWQKEMIRLLGTRLKKWVLFNPRRDNFPINDRGAAKVQISWEHTALRLAQLILFWFPCETLCPIVLYELGAWSMTDKPIFVGCHPNYPRRQDVLIQTKLSRPEVNVVANLRALANEVAATALR